MADLTERPRHVNLTDVAKLVRGALRAEFPGTKFSVRSHRYSGGSSIRVNWTDGPTWRKVRDVCNRYEGATFDAMIDLKSHKTTLLTTDDGVEEVSLGVDYVLPQRDVSEEFKRETIPLFEKQYGPYDPDKQYEGPRQCLDRGERLLYTLAQNTDRTTEKEGRSC